MSDDLDDDDHEMFVIEFETLAAIAVEKGLLDERITDDGVKQIALTALGRTMRAVLNVTAQVTDTDGGDG